MAAIEAFRTKGVKMKSKATLATCMILLIALVGGGYFYYSAKEKERQRLEAVSNVLKNHYGYTDAGYTFQIKTYRKDGPAEYALVSITYLPENISWDVSCSKIGDVIPWDRAPEQAGKDMRDLDDIGHCLRSLAGGLRIGENVYNSGSEVNNCRDAIKTYNIKHPKAGMSNISY